jgi:uncharacterized RDD family membrane protein YckC
MFCAQCGAQNLSEAKFCVGCGQPVGIAATPVAASTPNATTAQTSSNESSPTTLNYAGFWIRVVAALIDFVPYVVVMGVLAVPYFLVVAAFEDSDSAVPTLLMVVLCLAFAVFCALWEAFFTSSVWQGTPGKKILGLKVTNLDGERISFVRGCSRYLAKAFVSSQCLNIGFLFVPFTAKKQGLHDLICSTVVVKSKDE